MQKVVGHQIFMYGMIMLFFFFENKDIKLKDYTKECGRLKDYLDFLYLNLVRNEKRKPKGVGQLLKNVQRIRTGEFQRRWDPACPKDAIVYPILVLTDAKRTMSVLRIFFSIGKKRNTHFFLLMVQILCL